MDCGIVVENAAFAFGDSLIFDAVSLSIPTGELWALIGRSGVGKSTLLQIVTGLFEPLRGSVTVAGRHTPGPGRIKGVVFQEDSLLGWLTIRENVLFPLRNGERSDADNYATKLLTEVGLSGSEGALPMTLSVGMRKRAEFARALMADDRYLLADEPFGPLDALTRRDLWRLWQRLRTTKPRTGILTTHDPEEAIRLCEVVVPLLPGPPARLGEPIKVPSSLGGMAPDKSNDQFFAFRETLVRALSDGE